MKQRSALVIIDVQNGALASEAPVGATVGLRAIPGALSSRARDVRCAPVR
ncbi:hypothetical protein WME90_05905 [Sorangium sp. So ce375]